MNLTVRGINYVPSQETKDFIDKKLKKLGFADDYLHDLDIAIRRETKGIGYHVDAVLHFKWKSEKIVSQDCYELYEGIELIADKIQSVAKKEKDKVMNI